VTGRPSGSTELAVEHGIPYAVLVEKAEAVRADLLIVGSRGATGLRRLLLGSVAERVVRYAHSPVLVARDSPKSGHVLVGTDFSDPALPAVAAAVAEARRRSANLTIVHNVGIIGTLIPSMEGMHVVPTLSLDYRQALYQSAGERLTEAMARFGGKGEPVVTEGDAAVGIARLAETLPAQLVVVGTSGTTGLRRMLLGSVAEAVVRIAPCSVLVVRLGTTDPDDSNSAKRSAEGARLSQSA
jgi:nucleotide-binding universal stress UspA family protein